MTAEETKYVLENVDTIQAFTPNTKRIEKNRLFYDCTGEVVGLDDSSSSMSCKIIKKFEVVDGQIEPTEWYTTNDDKGNETYIRYVCKSMIGTLEEVDGEISLKELIFEE